MMNNEQTVQSACAEIIKLTRDRQSVLIFAATVSHGMQQALGYAEILEVPSTFSSNGDAFAIRWRNPSNNGTLLHALWPLYSSAGCGT